MKKVGFIALAIVMAACSGNSSFKTEGGTEVKYVEKGDGELPVDSLVSIYYMSYSTEDGKELMKVDVNNPLPLKVSKENAAAQGELFQVLTQLKTGDSVGFELVAGELFEKTFRAPLPDSIAADSKIKFQIAYLDQLTETGYYEMMQKKSEAHAAKQISIDAITLDEFMAENSIEAEVTDSGLRYVITEEGSGPKPENGQMVRVDYAGWVLEGAYFDTSIKEVAEEQGLYNPNRQYQPYSFPLGRGQVIKGWDEGIALLNEGSKARLYIPSSLGYGTRGSGQVIKPNSILVFDVKLVKVGQ
jgi:FKBP-type peptidyl-prolyl cis-trans isomerase FkpA